jgi:phage terminase large subunit-like protein
MSSSSAVLSRSLPRVRHAPRAASSDADDATFLASGYGLTPDPWQEDILDDWLGRRADGQWAAAKCGLCVPRQNGKNALLEMRELFGMVALGEKFLHTAHEVKTARKAFLRIASFFENVRQYPELAALAKEIRKTNGQEAIVLTNGGSIEFIARSKGSGRGFTVDVLVCDEAQFLSDEEFEALGYTVAAAPLGNPQFIVTGTPPDPEKGEAGEVLTRLRRP